MSLLTHELQEATAQTIVMDDDDPEALEVLLYYLYTMSTLSIHSWLEHQEYAPGTLKTLVQIAILADKYELPLLGELILDSFKSTSLSCSKCRTARDRPCIDVRSRPDELLLAYETAVCLPETVEFDELKRRILYLCIDSKGAFSQWWPLPSPSKEDGDQESKRNMNIVKEVIARSPRVAVDLLGAFACASDEMSKKKLAAWYTP